MREITFRVNRLLAGVEPVSTEDAERLRAWLGRNEVRFRCILEHHFGGGERTHPVEECEKDRCAVNWIKVYTYMNIIGIQLEITVYPVILWNIPLGGAHRVLYSVRFQYRKGWISKREDLKINGEELESYVLHRLSGANRYTVHRLRGEVIRLADYVVSVIFSPLMRCERSTEMML